MIQLGLVALPTLILALLPYVYKRSVHIQNKYHIVTMAQMAHFSFPYYFTIPNSEICTANFGIWNCEVHVVWASGNS